MTPGKAWPTLRSALPFVLAAGIFIFDLSTPLGYMNGALYVVVVIASLWQPWAGAPFLAAGIGTVLTGVGYYLSPAGADAEMALVNRLLSLAAIWAAALASYWPRRLKTENRRNEELFHYLAESAQIVLYAAPVDSMRMSYIDPQIESLLGYPMECWHQDGFWSSHVHPDDRADVLRMDYLMRTHGGGSETEYRMIAADGRVVWLRDVARVTRGPAGTQQYFGFLMDVTEGRLRDRQLAETQKMKAIGQLTGGLAHDFNNLLAVIVANLELMEDHAGADRQMQRPLQNAMLAARSGASVVQQLLAFARREPVRPAPADLNGLIEEMIELLARTLGDTVQVETGLAADLWPVALDAGQFEAALLNLAVNARDAMPAGGRLRIETANVSVASGPGEELTLRPGPYVLVSVSDTGLGMSEEVRGRALEPFFSTKPPGRGTGLGLAMVSAFVAGIGGQMRLDSRLGEGTTVKLFFPPASEELHGLQPGGEEPVDRAAAGAGANALPAEVEMARLADKLGRR